jgi:hypothetical protein
MAKPILTSNTVKVKHSKFNSIYCMRADTNEFDESMKGLRIYACKFI